MTNPHDMIDGYILATRTGWLYKRQPGRSDYSVFTTRADADATNQSKLRGTGSVHRLAREGMPSKMVAGLRVVDE